jgi:hypothetical protein
MGMSMRAASSPTIWLGPGPHCRDGPQAVTPATSALAYTQDTLWQMADALAPLRLAAIGATSVAAMSLWLITNHFGGLLALNLLAAGFVISQSDSAVLAWFTRSAAVLGGALGSGLESDETVQRAAHGNRTPPTG